MSYAISQSNYNNYSNTSYITEMFNRQTQTNANSNQNFQQSAKSTQSNASTNTQASANSTEYPRPSMNALVFVEEQCATDEIIEEINIESENTEVIEDDTVYYMEGDPRIGDGIGTAFSYGIEYREGLDWFKSEEQWKNTRKLMEYMDRYGIEEGRIKFSEDYGAEAMESTRYAIDLQQRNLELDEVMLEQYKLAMRDSALFYELDYYALADNKELRDLVQANFEERMSNLGYEKASRENIPVLDIESGNVLAKDPETGEMIVVDTLKYA